MNLINPEQFCCTYKQGLALRELGVIQRAYFWHYFPPGMAGEIQVVWPYSSPGHTIQGAERRHCNCAAYNTAELGIMLPDESVSWWYTFDGNEVGWSAVANESDFSNFEISRKDSEAQVRAELLIQLLQHELIDVSVINERLKRI